MTCPQLLSGCVHSNGWYEGEPFDSGDSGPPWGFRRRGVRSDRIRVTNVKDHRDHSVMPVGLSFVDPRFYRAQSDNTLTYNNGSRRKERKPSDFLAILHARYTIPFLLFRREGEINLFDCQMEISAQDDSFRFNTLASGTPVALISQNVIDVDNFTSRSLII